MTPLWGKESPKAPEPPKPAPMEIHCPNPSCRAIEAMHVRPAYRYAILNGVLEQFVAGQCVVCLRCDTPYVIAPHEPGGVIPRRKVAMGVPIPDAGKRMDTAKALEQIAGSILDEPGE